jgi:acetoin utilization protein AcuB
MKRIPSIKAMMTPFPHAIESSESVKRASDMMADYNIGHLPVMENGKLVGVVSERQIAKIRKPSAKLLKEVRTGEAYIVELTEPLDVVLLHMAKAHIDCAVVVKDERLVGIFTRTDACRCFGYMLRSLFPRGHDDDAA